MRIIIADNDAFYRAFLHRVLGHYFPQAALILVTSVKAALAAFTVHHADLLILSSQLPMAAELPLVRTLRDMAPGLPIIVHTSSDGLASAARTAGVTHFVSQRHGPDSLIVAIYDALGM